MGIVRNSICAATIAICAWTGNAAFSSDSPFHGMAYVGLEKQWTKTFNEGVTALDSNLYGKAEPLLKDAVDLAQRFGAGDARYPKSLGELGRLYTIRRRYAEAEPLFEQQLHFTEVQLGKNSGKTIPALGQMIKFYMLYGTAKKADPLAEELLNFIDGKLREDAEQNAQSAQAGKGKLLTGWAGTAPPQTHIPRMEWAVTCDRLGDLYRHKKNYDMSERFYKAALDIKVTVMGKEHMSMAVSYDNLGILAMDKEEYRDASDYFRESLETTKKIMGNGDPDTYARLDRLARALIKDKKYAEAETTYHAAMELWKHEPNSGGATARCLYQLGSMYCDSGNFGKAAACLGRALNISMRSSGPFAYTNVAYMRKYAYALYYCGRRGESDSLKARANWLAGSMDEPKPAVIAKPAEKPTDKAADKAAGVTAAKPGDKDPVAGKAGAAIAKGGKEAADSKTAKGGKPDKTAKASAAPPGTSTNKFNKPGMTSASETIKTMREAGKAGPMKPPSDDDPLSNPDLLSIPEEHETPPTAKTAPPAAVQPASAQIPPAETPVAPTAVSPQSETPVAPTAVSPQSETPVAPTAVSPQSETPVSPAAVSPQSAPIPGVPVEVGKTASDEKQPKDSAQ